MSIVRALVTIPADTGVGEDVVVNTWGFGIDTADEASTGAIVAAMKTWYDAWGTYRAASHDWAGARCKFYNLGQPKPRVPFADVSLGLSATASTGNLPAEVSICMSFQAERASGQIQRRRRGRIYLGPLGVVANNSSTGRPENSLITALVTCSDNFLTTASTAPWDWYVISEATGIPVGNVVHDGWIDNAWDTQRRRGPDPTARTIFTIAS